MRLSTFVLFIGMEILALSLTTFCLNVLIFYHNLGFWGTVSFIIGGIFSGVVSLGIVTGLIRMVIKGQISFLYRKENLDEELRYKATLV